jgi:hypothetical protein
MLAAQTVSFTARRDLNVGNAPSSMVLGDFNRDGIPDLAFAKPSDNSVGVMLGNSDGSFRPVVNYTVLNGPVSLAAGDFNDDGIPDLIVLNGNGLSLLLGNLDGTFQSAVAVFSQPSFGRSIIVGDFNLDGEADVAVLTPIFPSGRVAILFGNGRGGLQPPQNYPVGSSSTGIVAADFNNDGALDLAVSNRDSNDVSVLLNNGDGTFAPAQNLSVNSQPSALAAGDVDGDGYVDLVVANSNSQDLSILRGRGDGTFHRAINVAVGANPVAVTLGDFNDDGRPDVAVATAPLCCSTAPGDIAILLGNGDGSFQSARAFAVGTTAGTVLAADFNGDAKLDVVATGASIAELFGNGDGTLQVATTYPVSQAPTSVAAGDFNRDGMRDLAVLSVPFGGGAPQVSVLLGNAGGSFREGVTIPLAINNPRTILTADFNGDGNLDLLVAASNDVNSLAILLGVGDGTFRPPFIFSTGFNANSVAIGDFNGDGKLDIVMTTSFSSNAVILIGVGDGTFQAPRFFLGGTGRIAVGDFNHDGRLDLAVTGGIGGNGVSIVLGNGDGTFQLPSNTYPTGQNPQAIVAADLNGDGVLDLAVANSLSNNVSVLLGNGDGTFQSAFNFGVGGGPFDIAAGDFNGDGRFDLAVVNNSSNNVSILVNVGNQSVPADEDPGIQALIFFARSVEFGVGFSPQAVIADDFNLDGKLDLVTIDRLSNTVSVLVNTTVLP